MKTRFIRFCPMALLLPWLFFPSCNNIKNLAAFDVIYTLPSTSFTYIPASFKGGGEEELLYSGAIEANLDSILAANGLSSGVVGNTRFIKCTITILDPPNANFGWLQTARGEISENEHFDPAEEVGTVENNDPEAKTVVLTLYNTNIRPYLGARFFHFRIFGVLNEPPPTGFVDLLIEGQLLMHLEPLN